MAVGLKRYQETGHHHFVTFSCYRRQARLDMGAARDLFEDALERTRRRYHFEVIGYVVMPVHVHLLVSEPRRELLAVSLQSLKVSVARRIREDRFWQSRYYDFNVFTEDKRVEKLKYMHWNPVRRGLVAKPEEWRWSSYRHYQNDEAERVEIASAWTRQSKPS